MRIFKIFILYIIILLTINSCVWYDFVFSVSIPYGHFLGTPAEELAIAVVYEDIEEIKEILSKNNSLAYYHAKEEVSTPFSLAVYRKNYTVVKTFLDMGIIPDSTNNAGESPFSKACRQFNSELLELFLKYNPDLNKVGKDFTGKRVLTPLHAAVQGCLENVKILLEEGADPKIKLDDLTLLGAALCPYSSNYREAYNEIEIVHYLLLDLKVDFKEYKTGNRCLPDSMGYNLPPRLLYNFRRLVFPLGSREHKLKMECVEYLKLHGLDYWKEPIPWSILYHHGDDKEYLKKY